MKNIVSQGGINDWSRPDHGRSYAVGQSRLLNLFQMSSAERVLCFSAFQYLAKLLLSFCTSGCTTFGCSVFGLLGALHLCFWADLHPTVPLYQPHAPGCTVSDNCVRCTSAFGQILVRLYHFINSHAPGCTVSDNCVRCTSAFGQILVRLYHFINSHAPGCTVF